MNDPFNMILFFLIGLTMLNLTEYRLNLQCETTKTIFIALYRWFLNKNTKKWVFHSRYTRVHVQSLLGLPLLKPSWPLPFAKVNKELVVLVLPYEWTLILLVLTRNPTKFLYDGVLITNFPRKYLFCVHFLWGKIVPYVTCPIRHTQTVIFASVT